MHLSRRGFLLHAGQSLALVGTGLLAACQSGPQTQPIVVTASATAGPTAQPAIQPVASVGAATVPPVAASPAASPAAGAKPSASPAVAAASPVPAAAAGGIAGKPQYQMDALHTGRSPHTGPRRLTLLRSINLSAPQLRPPDAAPITTVDIQSSTATGPDGTIYATTFSGWTYALRNSASAKDQLELVWRFRPAEGGAPLHGTPCLSRDGSSVYLGYGIGTAPNQKAVLYAVRAPSSGQDAQIVWQADLGPGATQNSATLTADGTLYYVTVGGLLSAIDSANGQVKWTAQTGTTGAAPFGQTVKVAPAVAPDGTVYTTAITGSLYAISPPSSGTQGSVKWSFDFGEHLGPTPLVSTPVTGGGNRGQDAIGSAASATIGPDGTIYIGANNSNFYAIDPSGQQKWLYEAERELAGIWTTAALSADSSTLYFGANKGGMYALNARDGSLKWKFPIFASIYSSPALDARGTLYTGSTVGHVYAIDSATGQPVGDYDAVVAVWTAPSIRPDGTLVVADRMSKVLVLGEPA
jgi:outer membrane protein assembly factor BamB